MSLDQFYQTCGIPKPEPRKKTKARADRQQSERDAKVRAYVFGRERGLCRCCRSRAAESRHELRFRSLGGKVTRQNCVAVCGDGVMGCHGLLQDHSIAFRFEHDGLGAESTVFFTPTTEHAATWLKVALGETIASPVMQETEIES